MYRWTAPICALIVATTYSAAVASDETAITAYHAYQAAQAAHDFPAAEAAAKIALTASDQPGGDVNRISVLAFNLALSEIDINHEAEAIAPARRALELERLGAKGVDPLATRLLLDEAELSTVPSADEADLIGALHDSVNRRDLDAYAYPAAIVLGHVALDKKNFEHARLAFEAAARHAAGGSGEFPLVHGRALIEESLALLAQYKDDVADRLLIEAITELAPLAPEAADDSVSFGELSYSQALAVLSAERARQMSENAYLKFDPFSIKRPALKNRPLRCPGNLMANPLPTYPKDMLSQFSVGAATMRAAVDSQGHVTNVRVLAIFPESSFRKSLQDPQIHWSFIPANTMPKDCRFDTIDADFTVRFTLK